MELRSVIVNELNEVKIFVDDCRDNEVEEILENHPEWRLSTVEI